MVNDFAQVDESPGGGRRWMPLTIGLGVLLAVLLIGGGFLVGTRFSDPQGAVAAPGASASTGSDKLARSQAFVACMRKNGVPNHPEPAADGSIQLGPKDNIDIASPAFKNAESVCKKAEPGSQQQAAAPGPSVDPTAYVKCMREHGMPDFPEPVNGQFNFDADPKVFEPAHAACKKFLPKDAPGPR